MPITHAGELRFADLPGRSSADPFPDATGEVSVRVVRVLPGRRTPHRHPRSAEAVYVAEGHGRVWQDGAVEAVRAGDLVLVPRGVPHATIADGGAMLLVCFFPDPELGANLEELSEPQLT